MRLGTVKTCFAIGVLLAAVVSFAEPALADACTPEPMFQMPMVQNDLGSPIVSILIDNRPRDVLLDTGGFWSLISPMIDRAYPSRKSGIEGRLGLQGIVLSKAVRVPSIQIGSMRVPDVDFFEEPEGNWETVATLGANWLSRLDVEIDPLDNKVRLYPRNNCGGDVVHWPHSDLADLPVSVDRGQNLITIPIVLDGQEIRALIDTGATETYLSQRVAEYLFGLNAGSPGMQPLGPFTDKDGISLQAYRRQFASLKMGDIVFDHPWLVIAPMTSSGPDMILGMHQLHGLHLYFAYGEKRLFATTARGDIAARQALVNPGTSPAAQPRDPADMIAARDYLMSATDALKRNDYRGARAALDRAVQTDPDYAQAYVERAELFTLQGVRDRAIEDASRAVSLDPKNSSGLLERSELYTIAGDPDRAMADANRAMQLDPTSEAVYAVRAEAYAAKGSWDRAMQDSVAAIRIDPKSVTGYLSRSHIYELKGDYARAFEDADRAVRLEPKSAIALNSRCWNGAILAQLDGALSDCNAAVALKPYSAEILDSRAFVNFKAGRFESALADYSAALAINPRLASSLYGRGLAKQRMGDPGGTADLDAARAIDPKVEGSFGK